MYELIYQEMDHPHQVIGLHSTVEDTLHQMHSDFVERACHRKSVDLAEYYIYIIDPDNYTCAIWKTFSSREVFSQVVNDPKNHWLLNRTTQRSYCCNNYCKKEKFV